MKYRSFDDVNPALALVLSGLVSNLVRPSTTIFPIEESHEPGSRRLRGVSGLCKVCTILRWYVLSMDRAWIWERSYQLVILLFKFCWKFQPIEMSLKTERRVYRVLINLISFQIVEQVTYDSSCDKYFPKLMTGIMGMTRTPILFWRQLIFPQSNYLDN